MGCRGSARPDRRSRMPGSRRGVGARSVAAGPRGGPRPNANRSPLERLIPAVTRKSASAERASLPVVRRFRSRTATNAGMRRALALSAALLALATPAASARSPFGWRGIVEGAYGPAWSHAERARVLAWMPRHGFNAYVHAPKNDLYQRTNWRDPYPAAEQAQFRSEIGFARRHGIEWIPNLSPALPLITNPAAPDRPPSRDICFSCPSDLTVVLDKFERFRRAGARTFMVSFDDVTKTLTHPEDVAAYGDRRSRLRPRQRRLPEPPVCGAAAAQPGRARADGGRRLLRDRGHALPPGA